MKLGTLANSTETHFPSRQVARARTGPAAVSTRTIVSGSCICRMPVSRATVTVQIRFEPDIGTNSVGSIVIMPMSQSSRAGGVIRLTWRATLPRGSHNSSRRSVSWSRRIAVMRSNIVRPGGGRTPPTITSPTSPSAWQQTTEIMRWVLMSGAPWLMVQAARAKRCGQNGARSIALGREDRMSAISRAVAAACVRPRCPCPIA